MNESDKEAVGGEDFFKSLTGQAIKTMFRHIDRRLDKLEKGILGGVEK